MKTEDILAEMNILKGWTKHTYKNYRVVVRQYEEHTHLSLQELIDEADLEEEQGIRMKRRKIKKYLTSFIQENSQKYKSSTLNKKISIIRSVYYYFEIEVPHIPFQKDKRIEKIGDIPNRNHIKQALESTNNKKIKAIVCFMAVSGCGSAETRNITIQDLMEATAEYHNETSVAQWIHKMKNTENVVPTIPVIRQKTSNEYFVFCTPESMNFIADYLEDRLYSEDIFPESKLFPYSEQGVGKLYWRLNERNKWGYVNSHTFFRSHSMRKFFATTLTKSKVDFIITEFLLGHHIESSTAAYYKLDPNAVKEVYMNIMNELMFFGEIQYESIQSLEKKELEMLREKTKSQEERLNNIERLLRNRRIE